VHAILDSVTCHLLGGGVNQQPLISLLHFFRSPAQSESARLALLETARARVSESISDIRSETCFNVETARSLDDGELRILAWLLSETFEPDGFDQDSFLLNGIEEELLRAGAYGSRLLEVGPRMSFTTAWSTNAVSVCHACGLSPIRAHAGAPAGTGSTPMADWIQNRSSGSCTSCTTG